jgi:hypothetical protein
MNSETANPRPEDTMSYVDLYFRLNRLAHDLDDMRGRTLEATITDGPDATEDLATAAASLADAIAGFRQRLHQAASDLAEQNA